MMNSKLYSNLGYSSEDIKNAIGNYLSLKDIIASNAWSFNEIKKPEDLRYAVDENTIYLTTYDGSTHMIFAVNDGESVTQFAFLSDGSIKYRKGKMYWESSDGGTPIYVFEPDDGYTNFVTIFENYFTKDEINGFLSEVEERLKKLETPAHVESGKQKSLVDITTLQTEAGDVSDNKITFGLAGTALIDIQGYVDIEFECSGEIAVYIDDEKVYYFDYNTWSYIGNPEFEGDINKGIRVTCTGSSSITFMRFSAPSYKGGILTDEQAEKVIKTEVFTKAEKDKLASSEVFTLDEKNELARVSGIGNATYTMVDTSLIDLEEQGLISHDSDTVIEAETETETIIGGTQATIKFDAAGSSRFVKIRGRSLTRNYDVLVDGKSLFTGTTSASFFYTGEAQTIEFKSTGTATLKISLSTFKIAEFTDGHVTGQQVLDVDLLKEDVKTAQEDISGIEDQLANIYTKDETKAEITKEIEELVETTEGTLETLEKLKEALGDGTETLTAITDELTKKMEKAEIQAISDVKSPTVVYLYNGSEEDVPFTSATIFSLKTTKTRFALASDGKIYYQMYLREEVSAEDETTTVSVYSEWFEVSPETVIEELSQRVSKLEVPAHEELVETTLEELQSEGVTVGTGTITDNTWSYIGADSMTINTCGRVAFSIESQTDVDVYIDDVLYGLGSFDGVVNQEIVLKSTTLSSCSITFSRFAVTKAVGGILSDEQAEKVIKTEVYTTAEKNKLASMNAYTASEKAVVSKVSKIADAGYTWVNKNLIEFQNEGKLIAGEDTVVTEDSLKGGSEVTINVDANIYLDYYLQLSTQVYIDGVLNNKIYNGYAHTITFKNVAYNQELSVKNISLKIAQYNGGFITDEQTQDIEQVKHDTEWNAKNIDTLNTKAEAIKDAKATRSTIRLNNLHSNGQITNDTSELTCAARSIEAPLGGDTIIQYTGKARLALDPVENLALYIDDVLIEDNEFYGTINNNITLKDNGTGGYTANFSYIQSLTYTGGMFTDAEFEVYEDLKYDFGKAEVLLDEVRQKTDAHITNKSNPHGVTASQINAFTKAQTRTEIQTAVDVAKTEIDSTKADKVHDHDIASYSEDKAVSLIGITTGGSGHASNSITDNQITELSLGTYLIDIQGEVTLKIKAESYTNCSIAIDGNTIGYGATFDVEWSGVIKSGIEVSIFDGSVTFEEFTSKSYIKGFMAGEDKEKLDKKADKSEVANALKGNVSGEIVAMSDVSPVEHDVDVWVHSENLLPVPYFETSKELAGVTYEAQDDGGILLSGTPTEYTYLRLYDGVCLEKEKPITISLTGEFTNAVFDFALFNASDVAVGAFNSKTREGNVITINTKDYPMATRWTLAIKREADGVEMTGVVYPKIEIGEAATPYKPWFDVTGAKVTRANKNIIPLPYDFTYTTTGGITVTPLEDGGIKVVGTNTNTEHSQTFFLAGKNIQYANNLPIKKGTYYLSGTKSNAEVKISYWESETATRKSNTAPCVLNLTEQGARYAIYISIAPGAMVNTVVYPQLELGDTPTVFEKPVEQEAYAPDSNGKVIIPALYPTTTLFTDMDDAIIEAKYNRDLNKSFGDIDSALDAILAIQDSLIGDYVSEEAEVINEGGDTV